MTITPMPAPEGKPKPDRVFDPFEFDRNYSVDKFYTGATDGRGITSRAIYVPLAPSLYMEIERWLAARTIPKYRSKADFLRDALRHRLEYLNKAVRDPEMQLVLKQATQLSEVMAIRVKSDEDHKRLKEATADCATYVARGDWRSLSLLLDLLEEHNEDTFEPWKSEAEQLIKTYKPKVEGKEW